MKVSVESLTESNEDSRSRVRFYSMGFQGGYFREPNPEKNLATWVPLPKQAVLLTAVILCMHLSYNVYLN